MINAMALKKCMNENLWRPILNDLDDSIRLGSVNNVQIYYLIRSLSAVNMLDGEVTKQLVEYLVRRGYDSDNLMQMSSRVGGYRRAVHLISLIAESKSNLKNKHFLRHVEIFVKNCFKDMKQIQLMRLIKALSQLESFKNEKLINQLRKASFGKQLG